MNLRAHLGPALLALSLSVGACATGEAGSDTDDAATVTDSPTTPATDTPTFDLVNPLDDVGEVDTGSGDLDAGTPDSGTPDSGTPDLGTVDVGTPDVGSSDVGTPDVGTVDVGGRDVATPDVGSVDTGGCSSGETTCAGGCVDVLRDARNCGACGRACGTGEACTNGVCASTCAAPRMLCGSGAATRCVDLRGDEANCGRCGNACATGSTCAAGICSAAACMATASDCDGSAANGCEVIHGSAANTCATGESLGAFCGDTSCGTFCPSTSLRTVATRTGNRSRWFHVRLNECSLCGASLNARVRLRVPAGVDYDLFVYRPCGTLIGSSQALAGLTDEVTVSQSESPLSSDSFDFVIEVRWFNSGASCMPWTLTVEARSASATSC